MPPQHRLYPDLDTLEISTSYKPFLRGFLCDPQTLLAKMSLNLNSEQDPLPFADCPPAELTFVQTPPPTYRRHSASPGPSSRTWRTLSFSPKSLVPDKRKTYKRDVRRPMTRRSVDPPSSQQFQPLVGSNPPTITTSLSSVIQKFTAWILSVFGALFTTNWPTLLGVALPSIAIIYICHILYPFTQSLGNIVSGISNISPEEIIRGVWNPAASAISTISVTALWCKGVGLGCPSAPGDSPFSTSSFESLSTSPDGFPYKETEEISAGNDFFDCLGDLLTTRPQRVAASHLVTLAPKIMQWEHLLEDAEDLSKEIRKLAKARTDIVMNANAARVMGGAAVGTLVSEFDRARMLSDRRTSPKHLVSHLSQLLGTVQANLKSTTDYTVETSHAVRTAENSAKAIADMAHKEMSRLRRINNEETKSLKWMAWKWMQPGVRNEIEERKDAASFLKELLTLVDSGVIVLMTNSMSLQQCAINTIEFSGSVERALSQSSHNIDIHSQIKHLIPRMTLLEGQLDSLRSTKDDTLSIGGRAGPAAAAPDAGSPPK